MDKKEYALKKHEEWQGKIEINLRAPINNKDDLAVAYTPGVAEPCLKIKDDIDLSYTYTRRGNIVAVITDGTAVLGLGDIGPEAGMPVMEGKCALFKRFANIDALPICVRSKEPDEIVKTISLIAGSFGGINLEDISSPRCIEIENRLREICDIPVFHDDQHGTAIIILAALLNALRIVDKKIEDINIVINGAGAAGLAAARLMMSAGAKNIVLCDSKGVIHKNRSDLNVQKVEILKFTNLDNVEGTLADAMKGADVFIGVSAPNVVSQDMVKSMADKPIVFAMSNPVPEIMPDLAKEAGAAVVGTGRSDFPNQINNVLAFPGIFRGALDVRASDINAEMKMAAAHAIAGIITEKELSPDYVIPDPFDERVVNAVSKAVAEAAVKSGVACKR